VLWVRLFILQTFQQAIQSHSHSHSHTRPFVTLLVAPSVYTVPEQAQPPELSERVALTHAVRNVHDAVLISANMAIADSAWALELANAGPRLVIFDRELR
jgi:riboflavin biosynthesis pyrimidine reductase